jgi:hypothetical protein
MLLCEATVDVFLFSTGNRCVAWMLKFEVTYGTNKQTLVTYELADTATVEQLRHKIEQSFKVPPSHQILAAPRKQSLQLSKNVSTAAKLVDCGAKIGQVIFCFDIIDADYF